MYRLAIFLVSVLLLLTACGSPKSASSSKYRPNSHTAAKAPNKKPASVKTSPESRVSYTGSLQKNKNGYLLADGLTNNRDMNHLINEWLGVPHKMGGKSKSGIDCSGFTSVILDEIYDIDLRGPSSVMATRTQPIDKEELQEGDLVFFKIGSTKVSHVGVYLNQGYFAHATLQKGVMISSLTEPYYSKYFFRAGRIL